MAVTTASHCQISNERVMDTVFLLRDPRLNLQILKQMKAVCTRAMTRIPNRMRVECLLLIAVAPDLCFWSLRRKRMLLATVLYPHNLQWLTLHQTSWPRTTASTLLLPLSWLQPRMCSQMPHFRLDMKKQVMCLPMPRFHAPLLQYSTLLMFLLRHPLEKERS